MIARFVAVTSVIAITTAATAWAKGPWPRMTRVIEVADRPDHLEAMTNYGLLSTLDRGKTWTFACSRAFFADSELGGATMFDVAAGPALIASANGMALAISGDEGCDWRTSIQTMSPATETVSAFAVAPSDLSKVAAVKLVKTEGGFDSRLFISKDAGSTWVPPEGVLLPVHFVVSLAIDPRDPAHFYAIGRNDATSETEPAQWLTSTNGGIDWTRDAIPNTDPWNMPYVAAVHPADSNKVFLRVDSWTRTGPSLGKDALLYSEDGGKNWSVLLRPSGSNPEVPGGKLLGFALSPDATTALAAFGDLVDSERKVDPTVLGLYVSARDGSYSFGSQPQPILNESLTCLTWTRTGVYACASTLAEPIALLFSSDPALAPSSFEPLFRRDAVHPFAACSGRASTNCTWTDDCRTVGVCPSGDAGSPPIDDASHDDGGAADAPAMGEPDGLVSGRPSPPDGGTVDATPVTSQCDCTTARRTGRSGATAIAVLVGIALGARRRSRRAPAHPELR